MTARPEEDPWQPSLGSTLSIAAFTHPPCRTSHTSAAMADRFKNIAKNGWHPEKSKSSGSAAAGDSRMGQVVGNKSRLHGMQH